MEFKTTDWLGFIQFSILILWVGLVVGCIPVRLDKDFCPIGVEPQKTTILLLDTSDPLEPKHVEYLRKLVIGMQNPDGDPDFLMNQGDELLTYELTTSLHDVKPIFRICSPGVNPSDWDAARDLTEGRELVKRQWDQFESRLSELFAITESADLQSSPILEFLAVIATRHIPSKRSGSEKKIHVIIYSDLLQSSPVLSHYKQYPDVEDFRETSQYRNSKSDLHNVDVSIYRLERKRDGIWQTPRHYYWWTDLIKAYGGTIVYQASI